MPNKHKQKPSNQRRTNGDHKPTNPSDQSTLNADRIYTVRIEATADDKERYSNESTDRKKQLGVQKRLNVLTGIAAGFAAVYAAITFFQWQDLKHNFAAEQRAWIRVDAGMPTLLEPNSGIEVQISNVGKSPALRISGNIVMQVLDADKGPDLKPGTKFATQTIASNMIFPNVNVPVTIHRNSTGGTIKPLDVTEIHRLQSGDAYLVAFGIIGYSDQFGDHWTRFCDWKTYQPFIKSFHSRSCVEWNSVGDGSPKLESRD